MDGVYLKRSWGDEIQNVSVLVAIGVDQNGYREIKRRTRAIGAFPDENSALMLVCARLRYVAGSSWGEKRYMNNERLFNIIKIRLLCFPL